MLSVFQKAVLGAIAGSALLLALVIAAKGGVVAAAGPLPAIASTAVNGAIAPGIVTVGDSTVKVKPDIALITVGAVAQAGTAAEAQRLVSERTDRILQKAKELGIADRDVKTAGYNIQPQYTSRGGDQPARISGYQAMQQIALTYRKVEDAGKALDALIQSDAGNTVNLRFGLDDLKPSQAEARRLAIEDARSKAEAMARTAGVRLGKILAVNDQSTSAQPYPRFGFDAVAAPMPAGAAQVPAGELDVVVHVQVQFAIE